MTPEQFDTAVKAVKWVLGGAAVVATFLLVQPDIAVTPPIKVALGAFLAFAAYVNPETIVARLQPAD